MLNSYEIEVEEPSGLTFNKDGTSLYIVSDSPTNKVYKTDLFGKIIKKLDYKGSDIEGVCFDHRDSTIWIIEEIQYKLIHLDSKGKEIGYFATEFSGDFTNGFEGICYNSNTKSLIIVNEKMPGVLIEIDAQFREKSPVLLSIAKDYSGICYDPISGNYLILSDESQKIYLWNKIEGVIETYKLNIPKAEGIAFNPHTRKIYIVSDSENQLFVFDFE